MVLGAYNFWLADVNIGFMNMFGNAIGVKGRNWDGYQVAYSISEALNAYIS
jgi:hypothetical protein